MIARKNARTPRPAAVDRPHGLRLTAFATNTDRGNYPIWSCGIAAAPAATPHPQRQRHRWPTFHCTASTKTDLARPGATGHGATRGCRYWHCTATTHAAGTQTTTAAAVFDRRRIARHARRTRLRLASHAPWAALLTTALLDYSPTEQAQPITTAERTISTAALEPTEPADRAPQRTRTTKFKINKPIRKSGHHITRRKIRLLVSIGAAMPGRGLADPPQAVSGL